jgi:putative transcriptional regulator
MSAFDSMRQGLNEALAFADGDETRARVDPVEVPTVDVVAIRTSAGLSQVLLAMIAKKPSLASELLR